MSLYNSVGERKKIRFSRQNIPAIIKRPLGGRNSVRYTGIVATNSPRESRGESAGGKAVKKRKAAARLARVRPRLLHRREPSPNVSTQTPGKKVEQKGRDVEMKVATKFLFLLIPA